MPAYERITESSIFDGKTRDSHELRYMLARQFIKDGDEVLDAGCGIGYGRKILKAGKEINYIGIDKNPAAWQTRQFDFEKCYANDNFESPEMDVFIGFEIIEHLNDDGVNNFVKIARKAKEYIIISTPIVINSNPYHKQFFTNFSIRALFLNDDWRLEHYLLQDNLYGIFIFKRHK